MTPMILLAVACAHHDLRVPAADATVPVTGDVVAHPDAQTEWWHVHADLQDVATGEPLHIFAAFLVQRTDLDRVLGLPVAWAVNPFHAAYVQISDGERTWSADRYNFPDLGAARFVESGADLDVRHGDWRLAWEMGALVLSVEAGPHSLDLRLVPTAPTVRPGAEGRVEFEPGQAHLWSQDERMQVDGRWGVHGETRWVEGTGFHKHQWGRIYDENFDGFQWISLDLPEGGSLSVAWLKNDGMHGVPGSMAWISRTDGPPIPLPVSLIKLTPTATWTSRRSSTEWPTAFRLEGPGMDLHIETLTPDQELWVFPAPLHVGPAHAVGEFFGEPVDTIAFVEQIGGRAPHLRPLFRSSPPREDP